MNSVTLGSLITGKLGVGTTTRLNPEISTVGATSTMVFRQNPNRLFLLIVNLSVNDMTAAPLDPATTTRGILIPASGGALSLIWDEDFDMVGFQWNILATAAASALFSLEITAMPPDRRK